MLKHLLIKNYALIQQLEMDPSPHLNIITGETGAGKSIMLGAIGLLLGKRADTRALFNEDEKCVIEGTYDIKAYQLRSIFEEADLDYDSQCIIRREISPSGKSRAFINDTPVTLDVLKEIGSFLMNIHSQHDTLLLGTHTFQLNVIDSYAQTQTLLNQYGGSYKAYAGVAKAYEKTIKEAELLKKEADFNLFLFTELNNAKLVDGEQEELEEELNLLENGEEIKTKLRETAVLLNEAEFAVLSNLSTVVTTLNNLSQYGQQFRQLKERAESTLIELRDIAREAETQEGLVEIDFEKIAAVQERLSMIYNLQQKHRVKDVQALIAIKKELDEKVQKVLNLDEDIAALAQQKEEAHAAMMQQAAALSSARENVKDLIADEVAFLLRDLGMPDATLQVAIQTIAPGPAGTDEVNLLFSANKGVKPQELKNVASGGEFSRLMFCIKYVLAGKTSLPTIIFDEIDTGISGEIAIKMVNMMKLMSRRHQLISISHLPQIAARGDAHYYVYKDNSDYKTISKIKRLSEEDRVEAIAKMIGGDSPSAVAFENARELMAGN